MNDAKTRWKLVWEFLEEYQWEPDYVQPSLLRNEPPSTGDERWDALLAALSEHLAAQHDLAAPKWTEMQVLQRPWFPAELETQRAEPATRWCGHRQHSASTVFTCLPGTGGRVTAPDDVLFGRAEIERALTRLASRGVVADVFVVDGAAMALAYDAARVTRDVDAVFMPHGIVLDEARNVAKDLGLPCWWLNEQATVYISGKEDAG